MLIQRYENNSIGTLADDIPCRGKEKYFRVFLLLCSILIYSASAKVLTYPAPEGESLSKRYSVEVDGKNVDVYLAPVTEVASDRLLIDYLLKVFNKRT